MVPDPRGQPDPEGHDQRASETERKRTILPLAEVTPRDRAQVGAKAANLAELARAGFPVPEGFVLTTDALAHFLDANELAAGDITPDAVRSAPAPAELLQKLCAAAEALDATALAVRSSGVAEDLPGESFAGQYETVLDVRGREALVAAVKTCWASALSGRVASYRAARAAKSSGPADSPPESDAKRDQQAPGAMPGAMPGMAVLVQRMVPADAAGVAFTANPVTGDREETTISAVRGLGERLVGGQTPADEWVVRDAEAICQRSPEGALTAEQALAVAQMARHIADHFGIPQDVEWAISAGRLFVLQARPMTALPEPVTWTSPAPGGWMRNFRLGEWLPEPVTPLFESWLLTRIEAAFARAVVRDVGVRFRPPYHVIVNGWYFSSPSGAGLPLGSLLRALLRHPRRVLAIPLSLSRPAYSDRVLLASLGDRWRAELLPRYQTLVASWTDRIDGAAPTDVIRAIDEVADVAGEHFWMLSAVGGHAWKAERVLARFYRQHLFARVRRSHQELLRGLPTPFLIAPPHAVQSLDWFRPTLGEQDMGTTGQATGGMRGAQDDAEARRQRLAGERATAEMECRAALASRRRLLRRFERLLALAQRYAVIREEQAGWFTLGWPLLRRAVARLGDELARRGMIAAADDIFFLLRPELEACLHASSTSVPQDLAGMIARRRREWNRQRRLTPPPTLGKPLGERLLADAVASMRTPVSGVSRHGAVNGMSVVVLSGMPASPGRATGPVRVVRGPEDFVRFCAGEVLVAQVTTPAWTSLFARAVAVITEGGSLAAHASLVAREYGIPAVVGASEATARLRDGEVVTVDGSAGVVELHR